MISFKKYLKNKKNTKSSKWKAGGFPIYVDDNGVVNVCLFLSNNPVYGGARYQMPKGHPDKGDTPKMTATREAYEETGIPIDALKKKAKQVMKVNFKGQVSTYDQYVFTFELDKKYKPRKNDEGRGGWLIASVARKAIRRDQLPFLEAALKEFGA